MLLRRGLSPHHHVRRSWLLPAAADMEVAGPRVTLGQVGVWLSSPQISRSIAGLAHIGISRLNCSDMSSPRTTLAAY
jgi:hypothetical protein